jgi:hypothetical protein
MKKMDGFITKFKKIHIWKNKVTTLNAKFLISDMMNIKFKNNNN